MSSDLGEHTRVGQRLRDRYRIVRELGSGVHGTVWVADDEATGQRVAVRFLPRALAAAPSVVRAVRSTGRSIAAGSGAHPVLVRVLEIGESEPGQPFAIMELVEGRRLNDIMSGGKPLELANARRWALDLGAAIEALHNVGLVHGGLAPRNVAILPDGSVKLMDIELAGLRDAAASQAAVDSSPAEYLSPEQIRRGPVTEKTDVYALAAIVYEMFSGAPPFQAATRDGVIAKHLTEPPRAPGRRRMPASVERIVMQGLEKDPERRPWVHEMLNGLWGHTAAQATRGWVRPAAIGSGVALAASFVAFGVWGLFGLRSPAVRSDAPEPAPRVEQAPVGARTVTRPQPSAPATLPPAESSARATGTAASAAPSASPLPPATPPPSSRSEARPASPPPAPPAPAKVLPPPPPPAPKAAGAPSAGPAAAISAEVQAQRKAYRVGWLDSGRATASYQDIVKQALVGYPREVAFDYRSADGQAARLPGLASELVQLPVDVVFAVGAPAIQAAKQATSTIPIVMVGSDAVRRDESSPNITGVAYSSAELARGWLGLLKEIRPLGRAAVVSGGDAASRAELTALHAVAASAGVKIQPYALQEIDALLAGPSADRPDAIIVPGGPVTMVHLSRIVDLAGRVRVPAIYGSGEFVEAGGLLAYGPSTPAMYRRAGGYIGKILGPTNPRDLPIEQPSRFELVVNLKTARALGLSLPQSLVLRADRVVQ